MTIIAICSAHPRASVQNSHSKGSEYWRRDVYHVRGDGALTLCGRDCSEWLTIGEIEQPDHNCCSVCLKHLGARGKTA